MNTSVQCTTIDIKVKVLSGVNVYKFVKEKTLIVSTPKRDKTNTTCQRN